MLGELIRDPTPLRVASVGDHPRSYGFPAGHPPMGSFLGVPIMVAGEPFGNLYLTEKHGGGEFTEADERALVGLAEFAGIAIDHARRYSGLEADRDELEETVDALGVMVEISRAIGGRTDLGVILTLVAKRGRALVSARRWSSSSKSMAAWRSSPPLASCPPISWGDGWRSRGRSRKRHCVPALRSTSGMSSAELGSTTTVSARLDSTPRTV